jgi:predicted nuclease of predicted toxin-antitoxin system
VRLLFDQNLSFRLVRRLADAYPESQHVRDVDLGSAADGDIWTYAGGQGFVLVSKDGDFHQRSFLLGPPPKFVWLRVGNCTTDEIERFCVAGHRKSPPLPMTKRLPFSFSTDSDRSWWADCQEPHGTWTHD